MREAPLPVRVNGTLVMVPAMSLPGRAIEMMFFPEGLRGVHTEFLIASHFQLRRGWPPEQVLLAAATLHPAQAPGPQAVEVNDEDLLLSDDPRNREETLQ